MARNLFDQENQVIPNRNPRNLFENNSAAEEEGFFKKLPRNITAGLANLGHSVLNAPHDIVKGFEDVGESFGNDINKSFHFPKEVQERIDEMPKINPFKFSEYIPQQQEYDFAKLLGQKGEPTWSDYMVQKGVELAPELLMGANALRNVVPHLTKRGATKTLKKAKALADERNIGTLNVNPELIEDARQFLPNILRNRKALEASHSGDYNSLFKLQSEVGQLAVQQAKSWFSPSERIKGRAGLEARGNLLDAIHENLQSQGHHDISDLLRQGQNEYRRYMKFKKYRNALGIAGAAYAIPKNPLTDLIKNLWLHGGQ